MKLPERAARLAEVIETHRPGRADLERLILAALRDVSSEAQGVAATKFAFVHGVSHERTGTAGIMRPADYANATFSAIPDRHHLDYGMVTDALIRTYITGWNNGMEWAAVLYDEAGDEGLMVAKTLRVLKYPDPGQ